MPHVFRNDKLCTSDGLDGDTSCVWWVAPSWRQVALTYPVEFSGGGPWKSWLLRVHWLIGQFGRFIQLKCNYEYIYIYYITCVCFVHWNIWCLPCLTGICVIWLQACACHVTVDPYVCYNLYRCVPFLMRLFMLNQIAHDCLWVRLVN